MVMTRGNVRNIHNYNDSDVNNDCFGDDDDMMVTMTTPTMMMVMIMMTTTMMIMTRKTHERNLIMTTIVY